MSTKFEGKVIALTGAASGIGLATAKMLAVRGAIVSIADLQEGPLLVAAQGIQHVSNADGKVMTTVLDVRDRAAVEAWIAQTVEKYGRLDGAVNLAGVIGKQIGIANVEDIEDADWDFVTGVNLGGVLNCLRAEIKAMSKNGNGEGGSIVNASSIAGIMGMERNGAYIASKHAVVGLTRAAAKECGGRRIRVNAIAPGPIDTPMVKKSHDTAEHDYMPNIPMRREGTVEEVGELICWLLCDGSSYVTGTVQVIDGGWIC